MDSDEDDLYNPTDTNDAHPEVKMEDALADSEEVEEGEEEDSDDDINFILDQKEEAKAEPQSQVKRQPSAATSSVDPRKSSSDPVPGIKTESGPETKFTQQGIDDRPGSEYPARHTSTIDPNGNPVHPSTGKPLLSTDLDADFPEEDQKPWRKPGSDVTDFFNYGFDEFTWASYCLKQQQMPKEVTTIKNEAEQLKNLLEGGPGAGIPGMPGMPGAAGMAAMPGMPDSEQMNQMMMQMMQQGMDPSTMDQNQFMQMMMGGAGGTQGFGAQQPGFGAPQGPAQQQAQAGFGGGGFDQGGGNFGGGGRGRGRGGRRNW